MNVKDSYAYFINLTERFFFLIIIFLFVHQGLREVKFSLSVDCVKFHDHDF